MHQSVRTARNTLLIAIVIYPFATLYLLRVFNLVIAIGFLLFVYQGGLKPWRKIVRHPLALACLVLFTYPMITSLWSLSINETAYRAALLFITQIPLFIMCTTVFVAAKGSYTTSGVAAFTLSIAVASAFVFFTFGTLRADTQAMKEIVGSFSNLAAAGALYAIPFLFVVKDPKLPKVVYTIALTCAAAIVLVSQSRSGLALLALAILLCLAFIPDRSASRLFRSLVAVIAVVTFGLVVSYSFELNQILQSTTDRILASQLFSSGGFLESILDPDNTAADYRRTTMYGAGLELIRGNWLLGGGYGSLKVSMEDTYGIGFVSHNWIITSLGEIGLFGLLNILMVIFLAFRGTIQLALSQRLSVRIRILGAQITICMCLLFLQGLTRPLYSNPLLGLILGCALGSVLLLGMYKRKTLKGF